MELQPKKSYFEPSHTAEHILNQTMVRMFGCERSKNAHIERKKSKCDYILAEEPTLEQLKEIESKVNEVIAMCLPVTTRMMNRVDLPESIDLSKLPADAGEVLRVVSIGDYDHCACIGDHVDNTSEIGTFTMLTTDYAEGRLRMRWKIK